MGRYSLPRRGRRDLVAVGPRLRIGIARPLVLPSGDLAAPSTGFVLTEAIIDTGASRTVINPQLAAETGLRLVDPAAEVAGVGGVTMAPVYVAAIRFPEQLATVRLIPVLSLPLHGHPVTCLIGRDILQRWRMVYDGRTGEVTLEEDEEAPPTIEVG